MSESTIALTISIVTALVAIWGGWRLWLDSKTNRHVQSRDVSIKEWAEVLEAYKCLKEQLEERLAANDAEIKELRARIVEMEERHNRERVKWEERIACLEKENRSLRGELDSMKALPRIS
jgi:DNA-binding transcriptional MerR regulator